MSDNIMPVLLVGAGPMAIEYARVLLECKIKFVVVGRGQESAKTFYEKTGFKVHTGGIELFLEQNKVGFKTAIIAVGVDQLFKTAKLVLNTGIQKILIEKPGALFKENLIELRNISIKNNATVLIAYNRRFYASVSKAKELIDNDGGITSFQFDFTEWSHIIEALNKPEIVKQRWFLSNSTHVADMAFYLGGIPKEIHTLTSGALKWHDSASIFVGSGITIDNKLFSYSANWVSPGRWAVEILTHNLRLIFKPLEQLAIQKKGTVSIEHEVIDDSYDKLFKPGLFKMVNSFINGDYTNFCTLNEQIQIFDTYCKIANYH